MFDQNCPRDYDVQYRAKKQYLTHPNDPAHASQVTISNHEVDMNQLVPSATTNSVSQLSKHT